MTEESENPVVQAHRNVVERLWTEPVLELCGSEFPVPDEATVLAAEARCGAAVAQWLESLPSDTRVMALESSSAMLDEARSRIDENEHDRLFFVEERVNALSYADGVFDGGVCLHGMVTTRQASEGVSELVRVVSEHSPVVVSVPLSDSFPEFYDLFDEALRAEGLEDVLPRIEEMRSNLIEAPDLLAIAEEAGLDEIEISRMDWSLSFNGGREYLYSPLIQETFFPHWMGAVRSEERDDIVRHVGRAIDAYWADEPLETTIRAGLIVGTKAAS